MLRPCGRFAGDAAKSIGPAAGRERRPGTRKAFTQFEQDRLTPRCDAAIELHHVPPVTASLKKDGNVPVLFQMRAPRSRQVATVLPIADGSSQETSRHTEGSA